MSHLSLPFSLICLSYIVCDSNNYKKYCLYMYINIHCNVVSDLFLCSSGSALDGPVEHSTMKLS